MNKPIEPAHVNEVLRVSAEITKGDPEAQMNVLTRALILGAIHYNVPADVVMKNFKVMYDREPESVMGSLRSGGPLQ